MLIALRSLLLAATLLIILPPAPLLGATNLLSKDGGIYSTRLYEIVEFYKQPDPVGLPVVDVPDPLLIPPVKQSVAFATLSMENVMTYGLSKFRIRLFQTELSSMKFQARMHIDQLLVNGSYTLGSLFQGSSGPFQMVLKNVTSAGNVTMEVFRDGTLVTKDVELDFSFGDMAISFENLGFMGRMFQNVLNSAPNMVLDMIKPFILQEAHVKLQTEVDARIESITSERGILFANSISPLDMLIAEGRMLLRSKRYDPYLVPDYKNSVGVVSVQLTHTWLRGLASFYRSGDVGIKIQNNTVEMHLEIATGQLEGSTQWEASIVRGLSRAGFVRFTVDYVRVALQISQALDLRRKPELLDLDIEIGNIQILFLGAGTLDYLLEAGINILPNLLRYQIMDAIEGPLKARIREKFACIYTEQLIKNHVSEFERRGFDMQIDWRLCERKIPEK